MLTLTEKYINFFSNPPKSYHFVDTFCLYNCKNDKRVSDYDRFGIKIPFVICKSCGLVRASKFLDPKSLIDFYQNNYTKIFSDNFMEPKEFYDFQSKNSVDLWNIISLYKKEFLEEKITNEFTEKVNYYNPDLSGYGEETFWDKQEAGKDPFGDDGEFDFGDDDFDFDDGFGKPETDDFGQPLSKLGSKQQQSALELKVKVPVGSLNKVKLNSNHRVTNQDGNPTKLSVFQV